MSALAPFRERLVPTAVLVLIALGGSGLAVAADRQHNPIQRPELTWRADNAARPAIAALADELTTVDGLLTDLSRTGRDVLGRLQALDLDGLSEALSEGDRLVGQLDDSAQRLATRAAATDASIERWRLGPTTSNQLELIDAALPAVAAAPTAWRDLAARADTVGGLVDGLRSHDALVFRATTAGRQGRWAEALDVLDGARAALEDAVAVRNALAETGDVATLDDLLGRYGAYDDGLAALYAFVRDTGTQSGAAFDELEQRVEQLQALLPGDDGVLSVIVGEGAGRSLASSLVALEETHGKVNAALESVIGE